jgi:hypothetical protein
MAGLGGVLAAALLAALPLAAQTTETIEVRSRSLSDEAVLAGDAAAGEPVTLTGQLNLPGDAGPYPAVVLMHGTDGKRSGAAYGWEVFLPEAGIATLNLDSYSGRGLQSVSQEQNAFGSSCRSSTPTARSRCWRPTRASSASASR